MPLIPEHEDWSEDGLRRAAQEDAQRLEQHWVDQGKRNQRDAWMCSIVSALTLLILSLIPLQAPFGWLTSPIWGAITGFLIFRYRLNHIYACLLVGLPFCVMSFNPYVWTMAGAYGMLLSMHVRRCS